MNTIGIVILVVALAGLIGAGIALFFILKKEMPEFPKMLNDDNRLDAVCFVTGHNEDSPGPGCTGVLIHPQLVLTAAHVTGVKLYVKFGAEARSNPIDVIEVVEQYVYTEKGFVRAKDNALPVKADIGLLVLRSEAPAPTIPLALAIQDKDELHKRVGLLVGYGPSLGRCELAEHPSGSRKIGAIRFVKGEVFAGFKGFSIAAERHGDWPVTRPGDSGAPVLVLPEGYEKRKMVSDKDLMIAAITFRSCNFDFQCVITPEIRDAIHRMVVAVHVTMNH